MKILNLEKGMFFQMGKGQNWRVVHPDMGAKQITLNHSIHTPGNEFTQHTHDDTEDAIVVLEGGGSVRQGSIYTPIKAGEVIYVPAHEVHGTVNTTDKPSRLISFQSPPDIALYRGERDYSPEEMPKPKPGHVSGVQIITMTKGGPVFGKPGDWRNVVKGAKHLSLDYIKLNPGEGFEHEPIQMEGVYVLFIGIAEVYTNSEHFSLESKDVIFLDPGDTFKLKNVGAEPTKLIHCWAIGKPN